MEKIKLFQGCCKSSKARKYLLEDLVPLAIKIDNQQQKEEFLKTGYYTTLGSKTEGYELFYDDYLVYDYKRNQNLKDNDLEPEIEFIITKDFHTKEMDILTDIRFANVMDASVLITSHGRYDLNCSHDFVKENIKQRISNRKSANEQYLVDLECDYKKAKQYMKMEVYPLMIKDECKEVNGPYEKVNNHWILQLSEKNKYPHIIKIIENKPYLYDIEEIDVKEGLIIYNEGSILDLKDLITLLKYKV